MLGCTDRARVPCDRDTEVGTPHQAEARVGKYARTMSGPSSVDPSSTTVTSSRRNVCTRTDRSVSAMNRPPLKSGIPSPAVLAAYEKNPTTRARPSSGRSSTRSDDALYADRPRCTIERALEIGAEAAVARNAPGARDSPHTASVQAFRYSRRLSRRKIAAPASRASLRRNRNSRSLKSRAASPLPRPAAAQRWRSTMSSIARRRNTAFAGAVEVMLLACRRYPTSSSSR